MKDVKEEGAKVHVILAIYNDANWMCYIQFPGSRGYNHVDLGTYESEHLV